MSDPSSETAPGTRPVIPVRVRIAIAIPLILLATLISMDRWGRSRRTYSPRQEILEVAGPMQAYEAWKARGLSGRALILFGTFPHLWRYSYADGSRAFGEESFVERAAFDDVVRRVYYVVPDESWDAQFGHDLPGFFRKVPGIERGLYMHYPLGLPVIATTPSSLPRLRESVLVFVDEGRYGLPFVRRTLELKGISSDVIVASAGM